MRGQAWMWMAVLMLGGVGDAALAQAAKTKEGKVKAITDVNLVLESPAPGGPPLNYVIDTAKQPALKKTLEGIKAGDTVQVTYAPNEVGAKVVTTVEKR